MNQELTFSDLQTYVQALEAENARLHQTQAQLTADYQRYATFYQQAPAGYFMLDAGGAICEVNAAGSRLLGLSSED
ncbi:MAG: PAS domain-containing protein [Chloroflexaceae bacterium]|nr:PAS domain-containing protein [Chloroflexaceae bacterium]